MAIATPPSRGGSLSIGIYGCPRAGKTRFLYQLLDGWRRSGRILTLSEGANLFLTSVGAEIARFKGSLPTADPKEPFTVTVRRGSTAESWQFTFRDLRGEQLGQELDVSGTLSRTGAMRDQLRTCDAFLFFFDPTSSDNPTAVEAHHQREVRRAECFVNHVLSLRQNRYLPVLFVQTRLDLWENDATIRGRAVTWFDRVFTILKGRYDARLKGHLPGGLLERSRMGCYVSSLRPSDVDRVMDRLVEAAVEAQQFGSRDRGRARTILLAGLAFVGVLIVVAASLILSGSEAPPDNLPVRAWPERVVKAKLDEIEPFLAGLPSPQQIPSSADARRFNAHLRWLGEKIDQPSGTGPELSQTVHQRMVAAQEALAEAMALRALKEDVPARRMFLLTCLEEVSEGSPPIPGLITARDGFWGLQRRLVTQGLGEVVRRRGDVGSPPGETLGELLSFLRTQEEEIRRLKVVGEKSRQDLLEEVRTLATFCEDRKGGAPYPATLRLVEARLAETEIGDQAYRALTFRSPGQAVRQFALKPKQESSGLRFTTEKPTYAVTLGLGGPQSVTLSVARNEDWHRIHEFDLCADAGPLAPLGLPLARPDSPETTRTLKVQGYEITLEFSGMPRVPGLLAEAVRSLQGGTP